MLVVRVEIWPGGDYRHPLTIATMTASNISHLADVSNYDVTMNEVGSQELGIPKREDTFTVHNHPRKQSVWVLIAEAITRWQNPELKKPK